eukprot:6229844-Ditylum_brightwellii.AAC.1
MGKCKFDEDGNDENYNAAIATIANFCNIPSVNKAKSLSRKVDKTAIRTMQNNTENAKQLWPRTHINVF